MKLIVAVIRPEQLSDVLGEPILVQFQHGERQELWLRVPVLDGHYWLVVPLTRFLPPSLRPTLQAAGLVVGHGRRDVGRRRGGGGRHGRNFTRVPPVLDSLLACPPVVREASRHVRPGQRGIPGTGASGM